MRSTDSTRPYHGHIMNIWDEYEMNAISAQTSPTTIRPSARPMVAKNTAGSDPGPAIVSPSCGARVGIVPSADPPTSNNPISCSTLLFSKVRLAPFMYYVWR
jgi:hypothetical protein